MSLPDPSVHGAALASRDVGHAGGHARARVVLVTGAARRLGREIALHLGRQGFDVVVHCRHSKGDGEKVVEELRAMGRRAVLLVADLADEAACNALIPEAVSVMERVDAVVNNASHFDYDSFETVTHASLDSHWRANIAPALLLARALFKHVQTRSVQGCVVNLSDQKLWNPNPDYLSYTLSKAALEAATTLLAQAMAPHVRVVGVAPGVTLTSGAMTSLEFAAAHQMTPLRRSSTPDDIARAVEFLLSADSMTGTTLLVDGGQHLQAQSRDVMFMARATT